MLSMRNFAPVCRTKVPLSFMYCFLKPSCFLSGGSRSLPMKYES